MSDSNIALVAFGANLDFGGFSPEQTINMSVCALADLGLSVLRISRFFRTPCYPDGFGPDYVNAVARVLVPSGVSPQQTLALLHQVEARFGRTRESRWGMRTLDLDLLAFGDAILPSRAEQDRWRELPAADQARLAPDQMILPHPRLQDRAFVLVPLADIDPDWRHPVTRRTVTQMLEAVPEKDRSLVRPIA